jgi:hypothetical protein
LVIFNGSTKANPEYYRFPRVDSFPHFAFDKNGYIKMKLKKERPFFKWFLFFEKKGENVSSPPKLYKFSRKKKKFILENDVHLITLNQVKILKSH